MFTHAFDVHCPDCGVTQLDGDQLWLVLAPSPLPDHIAFRCPDCGTLVRSHAHPDAVALLSYLVAVEELDVPAEARLGHLNPGVPLGRSVRARDSWRISKPTSMACPVGGRQGCERTVFHMAAVDKSRRRIPIGPTGLPGADPSS